MVHSISHEKGIDKCFSMMYTFPRGMQALAYFFQTQSIRLYTTNYSQHRCRLIPSNGTCGRGTRNSIPSVFPFPFVFSLWLAARMRDFKMLLHSKCSQKGGENAREYREPQNNSFVYPFVAEDRPVNQSSCRLPELCAQQLFLSSYRLL